MRPEAFTTPVDTTNWRVGDIVEADGARWRVIRKTNYNVAIEPYHWYDALIDRLLRRAA